MHPSSPPHSHPGHPFARCMTLVILQKMASNFVYLIYFCAHAHACMHGYIKHKKLATCKLCDYKLLRDNFRKSMQSHLIYFMYNVHAYSYVYIVLTDFRCNWLSVVQWDSLFLFVAVFYYTKLTIMLKLPV